MIGIDLGTTNTAVAAVDTRAADPRTEVVEVIQLVAPGELGLLQQLPSFVYLAGDIDLAPQETALPWRPAPPRSADPPGGNPTRIRIASCACSGEADKAQMNTQPDSFHTVLPPFKSAPARRGGSGRVPSTRTAP